MPIARAQAQKLAQRMGAMPAGFGQDDAAWMTATCNVLVSADDLTMAAKAVDAILEQETARPAPAVLRVALDNLRAVRERLEPDGSWKDCECFRGWVCTCKWVSGVPYYFSGRCRKCQVGGTADPARQWEGYQ